MHAAVPLGVVPGEDRFAPSVGADPPNLQAPAMHHDPSGAAAQAQGPRFGTNESVQDSLPPACRAPPPDHLLASLSVHGTSWNRSRSFANGPLRGAPGRRSAAQRERGPWTPHHRNRRDPSYLRPKAGSWLHRKASPSGAERLARPSPISAATGPEPAELRETRGGPKRPSGTGHDLAGLERPEQNSEAGASLRTRRAPWMGHEPNSWFRWQNRPP